MAKVHRGDQGLGISLKGALGVFSCPEMLLSSAWALAASPWIDPCACCIQIRASAEEVPNLLIPFPAD